MVQHISEPGGEGEAPLSTDREQALPEGFIWHLTSGLTERSRSKRFRRFMEAMSPKPSDLVLDVGVTNSEWRSSNFFEANYPWPSQITAVAREPIASFQSRFPAVRFVIADGRRLPFEDKAFDIGFSNAVVEHVGAADDQRQFIHELVRTCKRVFIATPNAGFPVDPHTLLPFVHWLPRRLRHPILIATGNARWATEAALRPLSATELRALFPPRASLRIVREKLLGMSTVLCAIAEDAENVGQTRTGSISPGGARPAV